MESPQEPFRFILFCFSWCPTLLHEFFANDFLCRLLCCCGFASLQVLPRVRLKRLADQGLHLPSFFQKLAGDYNNPAAHKHASLPQLSLVRVDQLSDKLFNILGTEK